MPGSTRRSSPEPQTADLFDRFESSSPPPTNTMALVLGWVVPCGFGETGVGWFAGHHCYRCWIATEEGCAAFRAAVARGEYDAQGYRLKKGRRVK